jgi:hypothetical protein
MKNALRIAIIVLVAHQSNAQVKISTLSDDSPEYTVNGEDFARNNAANAINYKAVKTEKLYYEDPINNETDWKKVLVLSNDSDILCLKTGEVFRASYYQNGMSRQNEESLKNNAIKKIQKMAAAKGIPIIKFDGKSNSRLPKSRFKSMQIVGTGYRYN